MNAIPHFFAPRSFSTVRRSALAAFNRGFIDRPKVCVSRSSSQTSYISGTPKALQALRSAGPMAEEHNRAPSTRRSARARRMAAAALASVLPARGEAAMIARALALPVLLQDERLTTFAVEDAEPWPVWMTAKV